MTSGATLFSLAEDKNERDDEGGTLSILIFLSFCFEDSNEGVKVNN